MPGPRYATDLYYLAEENDGLFLASDARMHIGVPAAALVKMEKRGVLERVARGVYRLIAYPPAPLAQYREAILAIRVNRPELKPIVSHESALALHEISDVNPSKVHITVPTRTRLRRDLPAFVTVHHADLQPDEIVSVEGVPTTTVVRTIQDCASLGSGVVRDAIDDALRTGKISEVDAAALVAGTR